MGLTPVPEKHHVPKRTPPVTLGADFRRPLCGPRDYADLAAGARAGAGKAGIIGGLRARQEACRVACTGRAVCSGRCGALLMITRVTDVRTSDRGPGANWLS